MEGLKLFMEKNALKNRTKKIKVLGINLWELLAYFIIYSILGYVIETLFALVRYGVLESRQSFLYGPFCSIYGIGAIIMIMFLQYFMKNRSTLFIGGFLIGSALEYLVSLVGELILHVKWWDYSNMPLNINGRICLYYSIFWGVLAIFLMKIIHPHVRNFLAYILKKLNLAIIKSIILAIIVFIIFIAIGPFMSLEFIFVLADIVNGCMAIPNLIGLIGLRKEIVAETEKYFEYEQPVELVTNIEG